MPEQTEMFSATAIKMSFQAIGQQRYKITRNGCLIDTLLKVSGGGRITMLQHSSPLKKLNEHARRIENFVPTRGYSYEMPSGWRGVDAGAKGGLSAERENL
ncbi:MAG: hypothetical protein ACJAZ9_000709 [Neolewinella sp.]|jgi:hypothetical protein